MNKDHRLLKLMHPTLGLCAQYLCTDRSMECKTRQRWKQKYGQKFKECVILMEGKPKHNRDTSRPVMHIPDGEVYPSMRFAAKATGVSDGMVNMHCNKWLKGNYTPYRFKWA